MKTWRGTRRKGSRGTLRTRRHDDESWTERDAPGAFLLPA